MPTEPAGRPAELRKAFLTQVTAQAEIGLPAAGVAAWQPASAIEACGQTRRLQGAAFGGD
jgi:hypothetical protein